MKKLKRFMFSPKGTLVTFAAAAVLLLLSSVGGARAALTYYSENHTTEIRTQTIDVALVENGEDVENGEILKNLVPKENDKEGTFKIGQKYTEDLSVRNSGQIDQYVRVTIYKYWTDKDGKKQQQLYPDYIELDYALENGWTIDEEASGQQERTVLYYTGGPIAPGQTVQLVKSLKINSEIDKIVTEGADGKITYDYQGKEFEIKVDVDAVQTHNAKEAIQSAWGKDVTVNENGSLSGI